MLALDLQQNLGLLTEPHTALTLPQKRHSLMYLSLALKMLPQNLEASQLLYNFYPFWYELLALILYRSQCYRGAYWKTARLMGFRPCAAIKQCKKRGGLAGHVMINVIHHNTNFLLPTPPAKCEVTRASESNHQRESVCCEAFPREQLTSS